MSDKTKGFIQLFFVILFIAGAYTISTLLVAAKPEIGKNMSGDRTLIVETKEVVPGPYRIEFTTTGSIQTRGTVNVVPQVSGRVIEVNDQFFEGGTFAAEDVLFQIEPLDFELDVKRLEAEVARAQTALDLAKAEAQAALAEWKQFNPKKTAPELVARKPQMAEAKANLKAAEAQLEDAKLSLQRTSISMPFAGRVLSSSLEKGQYVVAGQSYGSVFGLDLLEVKASLEDQKLEWLLSAFDPKITITATHMGKTQEYQGYLKRSASFLDPQTRFASVTFGFKGNTQELLTGTFVDILIRGGELQDVMVFPASALQEDGIIWLVGEGNILKKFQPEIIYTDDRHVAVKANGQSSVKAVINKISGATEGTQIRLSKQNNKPEAGGDE